MAKINLFWFRRDLRIEENCGLYHALKAGLPVLPIFIFDINIIEHLPKDDSRVTYIYDALIHLQEKLKELGSSLYVLHSTPDEAFRKLLLNFEIASVFTNHDYEPYAILRDEKIQQELAAKHIGFHTYKDQVIFERNEVLKDDGKPYTVFTPYSAKWKKTLIQTSMTFYDTKPYIQHFLQTNHPFPFPSLEDIGFIRGSLPIPQNRIDNALIQHYAETRDFPYLHGTSGLGIHLRFGTISIRSLTALALKLSDTFLNELIWREFYQTILWHFPHVTTSCFRKEYNTIPWRNDHHEFEAWCTGQTGYPMVDAGMRQLNTTGWMHNRLRMITASFLSKHLLIDWRWGEAYFAKKLLEFDLASNNGGWQWAAGCGVDAAPYFRIFNPALQAKRFDPDARYIQTWVPEYLSNHYPKPIVEHTYARERCLQAYKSVLSAPQ